MLGDYVIFPYIAVTKAEKGEFKEACAYVVDKKKTTRSAEQFVFKLSNRLYDEYDIFPTTGASFFIETNGIIFQFVPSIDLLLL
ncbi:hypothetical protein B5J93_01185 [Moraxella equi]|nr:hypothetical protein B5J93_01185 [Moraxella equi]